MKFIQSIIAAGAILLTGSIDAIPPAPEIALAQMEITVPVTMDSLVNGTALATTIADAPDGSIILIPSETYD
ncbi:MAG: hypothetical protein QNK22_01060, partial [Xanthomonadales bacterium]|nr:hypothetical protein [Xanthomonadales bacterium]